MDQRNKGFVHLLPLIIIIVVAVGLLVFLFVSKGGIKLPLTSREPKVELKTEYKNPFDKKAQYVNPYDEYKSPFLNLK